MDIKKLKELALSDIEATLQGQTDKVMAYLTEKHGDLAAEQVKLETESYRLGIESFFSDVERKTTGAEATNTTPVKHTLSFLTDKLVTELAEWREKQGKVRRKAVAYGLIPEDYNLANIAYAALTTVFNEVLAFSMRDKPLTLNVLLVNIGKAVEEEIRFGRVRDNEEANYYKIIKPNLDKRIGQQYKHAYMSKVEEDLVNKQLLAEWEGWGNAKRVQMGMVIYDLLAANLGVLESVTIDEARAGRVERLTVVSITDEWAQAMENLSISQSLFRPKAQPMVIQPKPWRSPIGGGYYLKGTRPQRVIRTRNNQAVRRLFDVEMPEVYEAINLAQQTPWQVHKRVLAVAKAVLSAPHTGLDSIPQRDPLELPPRPADIDTNEEARKEWRKQAAGVYRLEGSRKSKRRAVQFAVNSAEKFADYDRIYFPYNLDWRGRVNAIPAFNPQGNDLTKGLLLFADAEPITEEGITWLAIHIASRAGHDGVSLKAAEQWTYDNEEMILAIAEDPIKNDQWKQTDEPFCFLAGCFEWAGVKEQGADYVCGLPIAFDGSCSGIQHFSAMLRDEVGGKAVNLIPTPAKSDIYGIVAGHTNEKLKADLIGGTESTIEERKDSKTGEVYNRLKYGTKQLAHTWLQQGVTRNEAKRPTMTLAYGSEKFGFTDQILTDTIKPLQDKGEALLFEGESNKPQQAASYLAGIFWDSMSLTVTKAVEAMSWLQHAARLLSAEVKDKKTGEILRERLPIFWVTPDGFPVWHAYMKPKMIRLDNVMQSGARYRVNVESDQSEAQIDAYKQKSGISPNFVHSMDGCHLRMTVTHARRRYGVKHFHLIHDSFGTLPARAGGLFKAVREAFVFMYEGNDVLSDFRDQFADQLHESQLDDLRPIPEKGSLDLRGVLQSEFCFR